MQAFQMEYVDSAVERLMNEVDFYLHCEIDHEYQRDSATAAREALRRQLGVELRQMLAIGHLTPAEKAVRSTWDDLTERLSAQATQRSAPTGR